MCVYSCMPCTPCTPWRLRHVRHDTPTYARSRALAHAMLYANDPVLQRSEYAPNQHVSSCASICKHTYALVSNAILEDAKSFNQFLLTTHGLLHLKRKSRVYALSNLRSILPFICWYPSDEAQLKCDEPRLTTLPRPMAICKHPVLCHTLLLPSFYPSCNLSSRIIFEDDKEERGTL